MSEIILEGVGVTKRFRGLTATDHVDFAVPKGSIYGLIGPNGAGKSTLFNLVTGYHPLSEGRIVFKGRDLAGMPIYRRNQFGMARAFQISKPFPALTVRENVGVGAMFGRPDRGARAGRETDRAMEIAGITHLAARRADALTVGELRKLEIARAVATGPDLLLADEPCAGLNPFETDEMAQCLRNVRDAGATVWLVEHDMKAVTALCDRILVIDAGKRLAEGTPSEVVNDPAVISAYLGVPMDEDAAHA